MAQLVHLSDIILCIEHYTLPLRQVYVGRCLETDLEEIWIQRHLKLGWTAIDPKVFETELEETIGNSAGGKWIQCYLKLRWTAIEPKQTDGNGFKGI